MATTTNFGWETPDDTDLVKDGALAMRTLGNAIDASLVDLKGGTTGQVLSKNSNTDMDFTWVTSDDANAIQNAIVDAKGDLITATAADTPARLAVGSNGDTLVADSAATVGLRYSGGVGLTQPVINSGFDIWQRGTSFTSGTGAMAYTADRWSANVNNNFTISRQTTSDTTNLANIQYCARFQRNSGSTNTTAYSFIQSMETANSIPFAGKTVTMSFYARKGADFSAASSNLIVYLISGTGTDQNYQTAYTGSAFPINNQNATLTTTWQRFSFTGTVAATATELTAYFQYQGVGTAGAADYFEITGVQIDIGSVALPYRRAGGTIQGELAACQRYYFRTNAVGAGDRFAQGISTTATTARILVPFPVTMRTNPASVEFTNLAITDSTAYTLSVTAATVQSATRQASELQITNNTGATTFRLAILCADSSTSAYIGFSAEL